MKLEPVIGLEIHVQLKTKSKMFCSCANIFGDVPPNSAICPICLGYPGTLPVPNATAIEWTRRAGAALNCELATKSKFDRKSYFYPDLPKGYQISQYDQPFCQTGSIEINGKKFGITRVHMEEDTGKLIHSEDSTLIDFNRSGVPLVEIVTEPDFHDSSDVKAYLQKLQQIVRYLEVSNADMERGNMRLEPNISLRKKGDKDLPKYKVEVKNINSFNFVEKAINFEIKRQAGILDRGETPIQETRGFVEKNASTVSQRIKEEASDYRYFPEPDIPPLRWEGKYIQELKSSLPELPDQKIQKYIGLGLTPISGATIARNPEVASLFEETLKINTFENIKATDIANVLINKKIDPKEALPAQVLKQIKESKETKSITDEDLGKIISEIIKANKKAVSDFKKGNENVIMFLVGQVMKKAGKVDSTKVKAILIAKIK